MRNEGLSDDGIIKSHHVVLQTNQGKILRHTLMGLCQLDTLLLWERSLYSPEPAPSLERYKLPNQLPLYTLRLGAISQLDLRPKESFTNPPTGLVRPSSAAV